MANSSRYGQSNNYEAAADNSGVNLSRSSALNVPLYEMECQNKISCISWNSYSRSLLASSDYEGHVQLWDPCAQTMLRKYDVRVLQVFRRKALLRSTRSAAGRFTSPPCSRSASRLARTTATCASGPSTPSDRSPTWTWE